MKHLFLLLLLGFLCFGEIFAQVGINNPNPSQALDVAGKIKVGDDGIAPVAGTIRYNRVTGTFEGYDGAEWSVFNPDESSSDSGSVPSGSIVISEIFITSLSIENLSWAVINNAESFVNVPAGRTLFVTSITVSSGSSYSFDLEVAGNQQTYNRQRFQSNTATPTLHYNDPNGYLLIAESGARIFTRGSSSDITIQLRGFLL